MFGNVKCSSCGTTNNTKNNFCFKCGTRLAAPVCSSCGFSVSSENRFCPNCGRKLGPESGYKEEEDIKEKVTVWKREPLEVAKRFDLNEIGGKINKKFTVEQGTRALFLQGGVFSGELLPGTYTVGGLAQKLKDVNFSEKATIILVDNADIRLNFALSGLRTRENFEAGVKGTAVLSIGDPVFLYDNIMKGRDSISTTDLEVFLVNSVRNLMQGKLKTYSYNDLYGNGELKAEIQQDLQYELKKVFDRTGLQFVDLVYLDFDESDWAEIIAKKREISRGETDLIQNDLLLNLEDTRIGLDQRKLEKEQQVREINRHRGTEDRIDELRNKEEYAEASHLSEISMMKRDTEFKELKQQAEDKRSDYSRHRTQEIALESQDHSQEIRQKEIENKLKIQILNDEYQRGTRAFEDEYKDKRREIERDQDKRELTDALETKHKMEEMKIQRIKAEQELEIKRKTAETEIESLKLEARSKASSEALLSISEGEQASHIAELARMKAASSLNEGQLMALSAKDSVAVAEALKAKYSGEAVSRMYEERLQDQSNFVNKINEMADRNSDRAERVSSESMKQMAWTASTRASAPSNTTIVPGNDSGKHVIVGSGIPQAAKETEKVVICRNCRHENSPDTKFCTSCGDKL